MKKSVMFSIMLLFLFSLSFVSAFPDTSKQVIEVEGETYDVEMTAPTVFRVIDSSGNGDARQLDLQSSQPYTQEEVNNVHFILTYSHDGSAFSYFNSTAFVGVQKYLYINGTIEGAKTNISFDGKEYSIELVAGSDSASSFRVIDNLGNSDSKNIGEYPSVEDDFHQWPIQGLYFLVHNSFESVFPEIGITANVTIFKQMNFFVGQSDECTLGEVSCVQSNAHQTCIVSDANPYLWVWDSEVACEEGEICSEGSCIEEEVEVECEDDIDCALEGNSGPYCDGNSVCLDSTTFECINPGTAESYCKYGNEVSCNPCSDGCANSECISEIVDSCDFVGLREDGKYCTSDNLWRSQKNANRVCENDFECVNNVCTNGSCQSKTPPSPEPNNPWLWIGGIAIAIILIMGLVILFRPRR